MCRIWLLRKQNCAKGRQDTDSECTDGRQPCFEQRKGQLEEGEDPHSTTSQLLFRQCRRGDMLPSKALSCMCNMQAEKKGDDIGRQDGPLACDGIEDFLKKTGLLAVKDHLPSGALKAALRCNSVAACFARFAAYHSNCTTGLQTSYGNRSQSINYAMQHSPWICSSTSMRSRWSAGTSKTYFGGSLPHVPAGSFCPATQPGAEARTIFVTH